jgi:hypothetical protein
LVAAAVLMTVLPSGPVSASPPPPLLVGVGRADITPPTGFYMMGWVRADAQSRGQHTRLFARAVVLEYQFQKVALVAADLGAIAGGLITEVADRLEGRGFSEENILISASHTHSAPGGYFNFSTYNTEFMTSQEPTDQNIAGARDQQLYAFMIDRLATAILRADRNLGEGRLGWGTVDLLGVTQNRSLEAHLANHGIEAEFGQGTVAQDPGGYRHTIDPSVDVLRVDKRLGGRFVPVGMWSTFANHGTVNKYDIGLYNADHHGPTMRFVEDAIRAAGKVPRGQDVVNAFGNTDEGDVTSGIEHTGPAGAEAVGRRQAAAMLMAWRQAGRRMTSHPRLEGRWTRVCFCGQEVEGGTVDSEAVIGLPLFTGSEEGRGPLYDVTQVPFEGRRLPARNPLRPTQGHKIPVISLDESSVPNAVPLLAVRVGDRLIVSVPGEMTAGMGHRVRAAVLAASRRGGIRRVVISGLANEYLNYFATPEEYARQHYEGGSTLYGEFSSNLVMESLVGLATSLVRGLKAPEPHAFDPTNGVSPEGEPFSRGATAATPAEQPTSTRPGATASFVWDGGLRGFDRPLDRAFVSIERVSGGRKVVTTDLGLRIVWEVDDEGRYTATWHVPSGTPSGTYRFLISANGYRLSSRAFRVHAPGRRPYSPPAADGSAFVCLLSSA